MKHEISDDDDRLQPTRDAARVPVTRDPFSMAQDQVPRMLKPAPWAGELISSQETNKRRKTATDSRTLGASGHDSMSSAIEEPPRLQDELAPQLQYARRQEAEDHTLKKPPVYVKHPATLITSSPPSLSTSSSLPLLSPPRRPPEEDEEVASPVVSSPSKPNKKKKSKKKKKKRGKYGGFDDSLEMTVEGGEILQEDKEQRVALLDDDEQQPSLEDSKRLSLRHRSSSEDSDSSLKGGGIIAIGIPHDPTPPAASPRPVTPEHNNHEGRKRKVAYAAAAASAPMAPSTSNDDLEVDEDEDYGRKESQEVVARMAAERQANKLDGSKAENEEDMIRDVVKRRSVFNADHSTPPTKLLERISSGDGTTGSSGWSSGTGGGAGGTGESSKTVASDYGSMVKRNSSSILSPDRVVLRMAPAVPAQSERTRDEEVDRTPNLISGGVSRGGASLISSDGQTGLLLIAPSEEVVSQRALTVGTSTSTDEASSIAQNRGPGAWAVVGIGGSRAAAQDEEGQSANSGPSALEEEYQQETRAHPPGQSNGGSVLGRDPTQVDTQQATSDHETSLFVDPDISAAIEAGTLNIEAELHEEVIVDGQTFDPEAEAARHRRRLRWQQLAILLLLVAIATAVGTALTLTQDNRVATTMEPTLPTRSEGWELLGGEPLFGVTDDDQIQFGDGLALSDTGDRLVVGQPGVDQSPAERSVGKVNVFDWNGTEWLLSKEFSGPGIMSVFGSAVDIAASGHRIVVGASGYLNDRGYVAVYEQPRTESDWVLVGEAIVGDEESNGRFGFDLSMAADGQCFAVSAPMYDASPTLNNTGLVRVYHDIDGTWSQKGQDIVGTEPGETSGWSLALSGDGTTLAIGAIGKERNAGGVTAYLYDESMEMWLPLGQDILGENQDRLGISVDLSNDGLVMAAGAFNYAETGKVEIWRIELGRWLQLGKPIFGSDPRAKLGSSVALDYWGRVVAVGSPESTWIISEEERIETNGVVQVFAYDEPGWNQRKGNIQGSSVQDGLGTTVALSANGDRVAVGAPAAAFDGKFNQVGRVEVYQIESIVTTATARSPPRGL